MQLCSINELAVSYQPFPISYIKYTVHVLYTARLKLYCLKTYFNILKDFTLEIIFCHRILLYVFYMK